MITLTLLHPRQSTAIKSWSFDRLDLIRVGRSSDNNVVLFSAVVSRHHLELRRKGGKWELVSLGTNGTYIDGKLINRTKIDNGAIVRLAQSGPKLKIDVGSNKPKSKSEQQILAEWMTEQSMATEPTAEEEVTEPVTKPVHPPDRVAPSQMQNP